jgi:hypothetical protein
MADRLPESAAPIDSISGRVGSFVTSLLAWLALIGAWDLASRMDENFQTATDTHIVGLASILRGSSNPREIDYEAMHEGGHCRRERCVVGQRVLDR